MSKITLYLLLALSLVACQDNISLDSINGSGRLLMYAFPTEGDTIEIKLSVTQPVNGVIRNLDVKNVVCTTNGECDNIIYAGDTIENGFPIVCFRAIGHHRCGDEICIKASAEGLPDVEGTTHIPHRPAIASADYGLIYYEGEQYCQLKLSFHDLNDVEYYAVRIKGRSLSHEDYTPADSWLSVLTSMEPLLNNGSGAEFDFGTSNDFYHNMYIFNDRTFSNDDAILRLPVDNYYKSIRAYRAQLLSLSKEYYLMLKSLNDINNNDMAQYGLAFAFSTYTNIKGGYGCVAGYASDMTDWKEKFMLRYVVRCDNPDASLTIEADNYLYYSGCYGGTWSYSMMSIEDSAKISVECNDPSARVDVEIYYEGELKAAKSGCESITVEADLKN